MKILRIPFLKIQKADILDNKLVILKKDNREEINILDIKKIIVQPSWSKFFYVEDITILLNTKEKITLFNLSDKESKNIQVGIKK